TAVGNFAAGSGAVVNWKTQNLRNNRKIRGRTFMVPYSSAAMDAQGTLDTTKLTAVRTATGNMISAFGTSALVVWCRPTTQGGSDGVAATVTGYTIPDMAAGLPPPRRDWLFRRDSSTCSGLPINQWQPPTTGLNEGSPITRKQGRSTGWDREKAVTGRHCNVPIAPRVGALLGTVF